GTGRRMIACFGGPVHGRRGGRRSSSRSNSGQPLARRRPSEGCFWGLLGGVVMSANGTGDGASAELQQPAARRKFWGWGLEGEGLAAGEIGQLGAVFTERLGIDSVRAQEPPRVQELDLHAPRLVPPASLEPVFSTDPYDRAAHTYGRSFRDLVRAFRRDFAHAPDLVAFPRGEDELVSVLDWCCDAGVAA